MVLPPRAPTAGLQTTWYPHADAVDAILWQRFFAPPAEGLFWYRAIQAGCIDPHDYSYGVLTRDGVPIGVVPAFLFDMPLGLVLPPDDSPVLLRTLARLCGIRSLRIFFVGNVAGEEGRIGLDERIPLETVALAIHDAARTRAAALGAALLVWKDVDAANATALEQLTVSRRVFRMTSYPGSEIPLLRDGYAAFLQTQSSARRHKIRRKLTLGESTLQTRVRVLSEPTREQFVRLFALFTQTYERGNVKFEHLSPVFFHEIARAAEARFVTLETVETHEPVAFMLLLRLDERVINRFVGIDYSRGTHAYLPFRLFVAAYDWAAGTGARVLQSGQTGYSAKLELGHALVPLFNYCEHDNPVINAVLRWAARSTTWQTLDPSLAAHVRAHPDRYPTAGIAVRSGK